MKKNLLKVIGMITFLVLFNANSLFAAPYRTQNANGRSANAEWNVNFNPDGSNPANYYGIWPGHNYFPSPSDWRKEAIYQFITDRFRDGDPTNNDGKYGGYNLYRVDHRHGGDFKGIEEQLDYLTSSPALRRGDSNSHERIFLIQSHMPRQKLHLCPRQRYVHRPLLYSNSLIPLAQRYSFSEYCF